MLESVIVIISLSVIPLITKKYWHIVIISLVLVTIKLTITNYPSLSIINSSITIQDSLSSILLTLSAWITILIILARYKIISNSSKPAAFTLTCIILLITLIISFSASSILIFYVIFEASLIPTIILIILWGYQPERLQASIYLILYTVTASLPLLLIIIYIYKTCNTINFTISINISSVLQTFQVSWLIWIIIITAFLVKLPIFLVHLWLPKAHVEAPVAGSIVLAAILLKLGGYGIIRVVIMFTNTNKLISSPIISIALIGGTVTSLICLRQPDIKSLIAYSSIGHIALILAGAITGTKLGLQARLSIILAHGLSSSAIFCLANTTYNLTITRRITLTKGLLSIIPVLSLIWFLGCCANIAAPPTINLISEIFLVTTTISQSTIVILPLVLIRFTTVAYSLYLYSTTNHGQNIITCNPLSQVIISEITLINLHLIPVVILILKPEIIISWC